MKSLGAISRLIRGPAHQGLGSDGFAVVEPHDRLKREEARISSVSRAPTEIRLQLLAGRRLRASPARTSPLGLSATTWPFGERPVLPRSGERLYVQRWAAADRAKALEESRNSWPARNSGSPIRSTRLQSNARTRAGRGPGGSQRTWLPDAGDEGVFGDR